MRCDAEYPRTLIVGTHFSEQSGSGAYLGRLFSGWPVDRLATVCSGTLPLDWRRCQRHYRTGDLEFRLRAPFKWLVPATASGPVLPSASVFAPSVKISAKMSISRRLAQYPWRLFLRLLGGGENLYRVGPSPRLLAWVREFQPEVIYGHCSDLNSVRFLRQMQQTLGLPLVIHFMDDWPTTQYTKGWTSQIVRKHYLAEFGELIRSADIAIAICQEMAEEYRKRYKCPVLSLPMPVELRAYQTSSRTQWAAGNPFRLRYGGRVGWSIRESLADIAGAVHSLRREGANMVFDIVTFQSEQVPAACRTLDGVSVSLPGPITELPRMQAASDVLIICYDFDSESFRQARFSMPSKLPECMASGTPILVYGPAGLPVVEYARREGWGKVVDSPDPVALRCALRELMDSIILREQLGEKAKRLAVEMHDAKMVSERFRSILKSEVEN